MSGTAQASSYFIGWDVGGWNCDKNGKSRDALVILDAGLNIVGKPWRGNLRSAINEAGDSADWIRRLFALCNTIPPSQAMITLAIDTPLGLSDAFVRLVTQRHHAGEIGRSDTNPYLFRQTERFLFENGLRPLSSIKDMIGSQATKGMHVLAKFARHNPRCGVWSDGSLLTVIEANPSPCTSSLTINNLRTSYPSLDHEDKDDALTCALIAFLFTREYEELVPPSADIPHSEGWIWLPKDVLPRHEDNRGDSA
ncbi:hypothetical protein [Desulfofustis limnaeus]|uniref:DUF429 domain-containing protein n=1 Tax=Desulfofustis limnaeus TaxID=2740163 RepID=A0ABM7W5F1_9BACT|nr:hypothetical protein [Desulfofustis limnaeus]BDD86071.1 hypothetical protein DPPLL_04360 [Desulfofustis limnaeus]